MFLPEPVMVVISLLETEPVVTTDCTYILQHFRFLKGRTTNGISGQVRKMVTYALHHVCEAFKKLNVV